MAISSTMKPSIVMETVMPTKTEWKRIPPSSNVMFTITTIVSIITFGDTRAISSGITYCSSFCIPEDPLGSRDPLPVFPLP